MGCHDDEVIVEVHVVVEMGVGCQASVEMSDKDSQVVVMCRILINYNKRYYFLEKIIRS